MKKQFWRKGIKILLAIFLFSNVIFAETKKSEAVSIDSNIICEESKMIDAIVKEDMEKFRIPGLAIGIVRNNEIVFLKGYGKADSKGTSVTPKTNFIIGSLSKSFTAMAIMQLSEQNKLNLDDPVIKYLTWFQLKNKNESDKITIRHLLNQTSGIYGVINGDFDENKTLKENSEGLKSIELTKAVGSTFQYSNLNYTMLGAIIENISGMEYSKYIKEKIFNPLEMNNSYSDINNAFKNGLPLGFQTMLGKKIERKLPYYQASVPAGYLTSNVEDMLHYLIANINTGEYKNNRVLSPAGIAQLHTTHMIDAGNYGMGWFQVGERFFHEGNVESYHSDMMIIPSQKIGIVVLINTNDYVFREIMGSNFKYSYSSIRKRIIDSVLNKKKYPSANIINIDIFYLILNSLLLIIFCFLVINVFRIKKIETNIQNNIKKVIIKIICFYVIGVGLLVNYNLIDFQGIFRWSPGIGHVLVLLDVIILFTAILETIMVVNIKFIKFRKKINGI